MVKQTHQTNSNKPNESRAATDLGHVSPLGMLKEYIKNPSIRERLSSMLGKYAESFTNSVINLVSSDNYLQKCTPESIMKSAMIAASMDLPVDKALGFAAIVPYGTEAQFQLMYKGIIQLAQRTGKYKTMHDAVVYVDELESHNPITGELKFTPQANWKLRYALEQRIEDVAGFYFRFELITGFEMARFLPIKEAMSHGQRFSKSYQADIRKHTAKSLWTTMPLVMGLKTIIKMTLSKYGIMSIEMQEAFVAEDYDFAGTPLDTTVLDGTDHQLGTEGTKQRLAAALNSKQAAAEIESHFEGPPEQPATTTGGEDCQTSRKASRKLSKAAHGSVPKGMPSRHPSQTRTPCSVFVRSAARRTSRSSKSRKGHHAHALYSRLSDCGRPDRLRLQ